MGEVRAVIAERVKKDKKLISVRRRVGIFNKKPVFWNGRCFSDVSGNVCDGDAVKEGRTVDLGADGDQLSILPGDVNVFIVAAAGGEF